MLISKFNLYKTEWLDLVFDDRNKEYGAYYLRQHYAGNMAKAMGITFLSIGFLCGASIIIQSHPVVQRPPVLKPEVLKIVNVVVKPEVEQPPKVNKPIAPVKPATPVKTTQFVPYVVKPDQQAQKPTEITKINGQVGPVTTSGPAIDPGIQEEKPAGTGTPGPDDSVHPLSGVDVMPEPVGGSAAWSKFLSKNLRFPYEAQSDGVSGRVYLSFIIEKDGHLSNITIDRAAGYGFDEEAMRVLKMAKAWKPGMQNGQAVRVKYQIPINFQATQGD